MSKKLDFMQGLKRELEQLNLGIPITIGLLGEAESIALINLAGGEEVVYMDRKRDKVYNVGVLIKHRQDGVCFNALTEVYQRLENAKDIPSMNDSYEFIGIKTSNLPHKSGVDEKGFNVWSTDFAVRILIYKGVI